MAVRTPTNAAIYCRLSKGSEVERLTLERQEDLCRAWAKSNGWGVAEVVAEVSSAHGGKRRDRYREMVAMVRTGALDGILSVDLDRLTRHPREIEDLIELEQDTGVAIATTSGDLDMRSSDGRLKARVLGNVAANESEKRSDRTSRALAQRRQAGAWGGPAPYGFRSSDHPTEARMRSLEQVPGEVASIRRAAKQLLGGVPASVVVEELRAEGVTGRRGSPLSQVTLRSILTAPAVAGLLSHKGVVVGEGAWTAILDRGQWERLCAMYGARQRGPGRPATRVLAGLLACGECGTSMTSYSRSTANKAGVVKRGYRCFDRSGRTGACRGVTISAQAVEDAVAAMVLARLHGPGLAAAMAAERGDDEERAAITGHLREDEHRLDALTDQYVDGKLTKREWERARTRLLDRIESSRLALAGADRHVALRGVPVGQDEETLAAWWNGLDRGRQRAVLASVVEKVTVSKTPRRGPIFDVDRLAVTWLA